MAEGAGDNELHVFKSMTLHDGWSFKQSDDDSENAWMSVKRVPSTVHQDLIDNGKYVDVP